MNLDSWQPASVGMVVLVLVTAVGGAVASITGDVEFSQYLVAMTALAGTLGLARGVSKIGNGK